MSKEGGILETGDMLLLEAGEDETIRTHIELVQDDEIWVQEIMSSLWNKDYSKKRLLVRHIRKNMVYSFYVEVKSNEQIDDFVMTKLVKLTPIEESERRESYRLQKLFDVFVKVREQEGVRKCYGIDISDTGMSFSANIHWKIGQELECRFELNGVPFQQLIEVVRVEVNTGLKQSAYRYGAKFLDLEKSARKKILHCIFMQQSKKRK